MARSTNDVKAVVMTAGEGVLTAGDSIITGAAVLIVMVTQISWQLTILALLPMPVMAFLVNRFGRRLHHTFTESQAAFSELSEVSQSSLSAVRMVRAFGLEQHQMTQFDQVADRTGEKKLGRRTCGCAFLAGDSRHHWGLFLLYCFRWWLFGRNGTNVTGGSHRVYLVSRLDDLADARDRLAV